MFGLFGQSVSLKFAPPQLNQCWKTRNISCGRGRARGPNLKNLAGAGGRGGQISKILRARAGAGAKFKKSCGRGRARGPKVKILAGAGGRGGQKCKILRARAVAGARKAPQAPATNIMANQCENFCGRGRARGPKVKNHAGAGGCQISIIPPARSAGVFQHWLRLSIDKIIAYVNITGDCTLSDLVFG